MTQRKRRTLAPFGEETKKGRIPLGIAVFPFPECAWPPSPVDGGVRASLAQKWCDVGNLCYLPRVARYTYVSVSPRQVLASVVGAWFLLAVLGTAPREAFAASPKTATDKTVAGRSESASPRKKAPAVSQGKKVSSSAKPSAEVTDEQAQPVAASKSTSGANTRAPKPQTKPKAATSNQAAVRAQEAARRAEAAERLRRLGAMSVGLPNTGFLVNGVRMPQGDDWTITVPSHAYATEETVRQLGECITAARAEFRDSPRVMLGSLSAEHGGKLPPHKSHRTGRDADVYFFRKPGATWSKAATAEDIDLPRTWSLLRCFVTKADVDMVLIDRKVQGWLQRYALSIGEPPEWVQELFHDRPHTKSAIVRHVPGHVAHMHVRFVSAQARRLGVKHYHELVSAGLIKEHVEEVRHTVSKGDTLLGLASRYKVAVDEIRALNKIEGTVIRLGQILLLKQGVPIEGLSAPIWAPGRSMPPEPCEPGPRPCHAGLALVSRPQIDAFVGEDAPESSTSISVSLR